MQLAGTNVWRGRSGPMRVGSAGIHVARRQAFLRAQRSCRAVRIAVTKHSHVSLPSPQFAGSETTQWASRPLTRLRGVGSFRDTTRDARMSKVYRCSRRGARPNRSFRLPSGSRTLTRPVERGVARRLLFRLWAQLNLHDRPNELAEHNCHACGGGQHDAYPLFGRNVSPRRAPNVRDRILRRLLLPR